MKKKRFCFKRAVSVLLAAAMILTAAPQTGMNVFATELENINVEGSDNSAGDGSLSTPETPETGGGQEELGDGSENDGDNLSEEPGDQGDPEEPGDVKPGNPEEGTEPAGEQEGDGEDTGDIVSEEESVSENTLGVELLAVGEAAEVEEEPEYLGEIKDENDDGGPYKRLCISAFTEDGKGLSDAQIIEILEHYEEQGEKFECVQLDIPDRDEKNRKIKRNILNAAIAVLNTDACDNEGNSRYWIDYNLSNNNGWRYFTLFHPWECTADININVTMTPTPGLGVKVKFPTVSFPAEYVSVNVGGDKMKDSLYSSLSESGDEGDDYRLFTLASGKPAAYVDGGEDGYELGYEPGEVEIRVGNIRTLKANTEYLMAFVADRGELAAGATMPLEQPEGWTGMTWKSYTPDIASIDAKGNVSAWDEGEALFSATGKEGKTSKTRFYRMMVDKGLSSMRFIQDTVTMEPGWTEYLQLNFYPSDAGCDQENHDEKNIEWKIKEQKPSNGSNTPVIKFASYSEEGEEIDEEKNPRGEIMAVNPGTAIVEATYVHGQNEENPITATCTITVKAGIDYEEIKEELDNMNLYALSGYDTVLNDVKGLPGGWEWVYPDMSLTPFAGTEGHEFVVKCTKGDRSAQFTVWVRMINLKGIVMTSEQLKEGDSAEKEWVKWIPDSLKNGEELALSFYFDLENISWDEKNDQPDEQEYYEVGKKLREKYEIEWSSNPKGLFQEVDSETQSYTASILGTGKNYKAEKKTFTVSLKDKTVKKKPVVFKASHTLTVTTEELFDWGMIDSYWENWENGKVTSLTFTVNMSLEDYKKQKLTFASMDTSILQLNTKKITEAKPKDDDGKEISDAETTEVTIPCTQKAFGRVWIKVMAPDEMKSSELFCVELPDIQPKIVGAATQTINKASTKHAVTIYVNTHEQYPLDCAEGAGDLASIDAVTIKGNKKDQQEFFKLNGIKELSGQEAAAVLSENGGIDTKPYIGLYEMELGLREDADLSRLKAGDYTVKLACAVKGRHEGSELEEQTVSLTVKVTDVKPKVTFKQTGKVNLFYTDDEGAGTLQVISDENVTVVELADYVDKNPKKNAFCHYVVRPKRIEKEEGDGEGDGEGDKEEYEENVYEIVRKDGTDDSPFNEKLKKGILKYTVDGYGETIFQTTFTVATENKAPAIVLSAKSDMLYPNVWYTDSWITMVDKATGESFVPDTATYYVGKGKSRVDTPLTVDEFGDPESKDQIDKEKEITGNASKNIYGLFVTDDGNIVSRLRWAEKYGNKADTINLELKKNNWSKPVAVSYKLQVDSALKPKLTLGKATLTLNKNADVYRGQQERTTLRLKGCGNYVMQGDGSWVSITGQDDKSKAELKGKNSSLVVQYWDDKGNVIVRFNDNDIAPGTYKVKFSIGNEDAGEFASTVLTVKIVDKTVKQSLKVTAKGSIDVLNREGTFISYTPKISGMTGTVEGGYLTGRDADLFDAYFEDGKLIVKAREETRYSTKNTYEVHTVFRVQTEDWHGYEISSNNDPKAKPFSIKVKQGKPKLTAATNGNTIYRQLENQVDIRIEAKLGKQEVEIEDVRLLNYRDDLELIPTEIKAEDEEEDEDVGDNGWSGDYLSLEEEGPKYFIYNPETKSVRVALRDSWGLRDISKNGTYKVKFAVRYRDKAGDAKEAEVTCPIVVR